MPSRFTNKKDSGVNEKQSVFDNKRSKYNLLCLYILNKSERKWAGHGLNVCTSVKLLPSPERGIYI